MLLQQPAFPALERRMDFRHIAMVEHSGQLAFYVVALPLALLGAGVGACRRVLRLADVSDRRA